MERLKKIINLQSRVLKIILGTDSREESCIILNLKQSYYLEVIVKKYDELKKMYSNKNSVTRNKSLTLTRYKLVTGQKNFNYDAIIIFTQKKQCCEFSIK